MKLRQAPMAQPTIAFAIGIVCALYGDFHPSLWPSFIYLILFLLCLLMAIKWKKIPLSFHFTLPVFLMLAFVVIGYCYANSFHKHNEFANAGNILLLRATAPLTQRPHSEKGIFEVMYAIDNEKLIPESGKVLLYLERPATIHYGDILLIKNTLHAISAHDNPYQFDFATYMRYRHINYSGYLKTGEYQKTGLWQGSALWKDIYELKSTVRRWLYEALPQASERGIAEALLLGDEDEISPQLMAGYAATGTIHILSVSGLHIGCILLLLAWMLAFLNYSPFTRWLRFIILIGSMWIYAFITGLSPPIARAVTMFSFAATAIMLARTANIYNSLATAAFVILLYDPYCITYVGFQLSFIAVLGIVWLYPYLKEVWQPRWKIFQWVRDVCAVSIAAQIAVFPLTLYYFHQFPSWFLPANLLIIPYSTVALAGCGLYIFLHATLGMLPTFHHVLLYSGIGLDYLIKGLNALALWLAALPGAVCDGFFLSKANCLLLYIGILSALAAIIYRQRRYRIYAAAAFLLFSITYFSRQIECFQNPQLTFFATPKHLAFTIAAENKLWLIGDSTFIDNADLAKAYIRNYACYRGIPWKNIIPIAYNSHNSIIGKLFCYHYPYLQFKNQIYQIIDRSLQGQPVQGGIFVFYHPRYKQATYLASHPSLIIMAATGKKTIAHFKTAAQKRHLNLINLQLRSFQLP